MQLGRLQLQFYLSVYLLLNMKPAAWGVLGKYSTVTHALFSSEF